MNLSFQIKLFDAVNQPHDERFRARSGAVVKVYEADLFCDEIEGVLRLRRPPNKLGPLGFVHVIGFPPTDVDALTVKLQAPAEHNGEIIRPRQWMIHVDALPEPARSQLYANREISIAWSAGVLQYVRRLEPDPQDPSLDVFGAAMLESEIP